MQEKLSKQNSWKEKPKEKRNFPQDGSHFDIKSVLNIISTSGIKKKINEHILHVAREVLVQCVYFFINQLQSQ